MDGPELHSICGHPCAHIFFDDLLLFILFLGGKFPFYFVQQKHRLITSPLAWDCWRRWAFHWTTSRPVRYTRVIWNPSSPSFSPCRATNSNRNYSINNSSSSNKKWPSKISFLNLIISIKLILTDNFYLSFNKGFRLPRRMFRRFRRLDSSKDPGKCRWSRK